MAVRVVIPSAVLVELQAIGDYIEAQGSPQAALQLVRRLRERCESLAVAPHRGAPYGAHYRTVRVNPYTIYYRADENGETVVSILTIYHMSRRPPAP